MSDNYYSAILEIYEQLNNCNKNIATEIIWASCHFEDLEGFQSFGEPLIASLVLEPRISPET